MRCHAGVASWTNGSGYSPLLPIWIEDRTRRRHSPPSVLILGPGTQGHQAKVSRLPTLPAPCSKGQGGIRSSLSRASYPTQGFALSLKTASDVGLAGGSVLFSKFEIVNRPDGEIDK